MFETVKNHFDSGLWSIQRVWNTVGKAITEEEYEEITELVFPNKEA